MLLACLEDIAQTYPFYCSYYIPEIHTIVLFLPLQKPWPENKMHLAAQKVCMLVVRKEASTLQFLIFKPLTNCFKETIGFDAKASFVSRP